MTTVEREKNYGREGSLGGGWAVQVGYGWHAIGEGRPWDSGRWLLISTAGGGDKNAESAGAANLQSRIEIRR